MCTAILIVVDGMLQPSSCARMLAEPGLLFDQCKLFEVRSKLLAMTHTENL